MQALTYTNTCTKEGCMTVNIDKVLKYADSKHRSKAGSPKYSMGYPARLGPNYMDCSSFVYYALKAGGWKPAIDYIGNTETLYKEPNLVEIYSYDEVQPGDIFIRGIQGSSKGGAGHTGIFYKKDGIVHCNYSNNGVSYNDMSSYLTYFLDRSRSNKERYFRPVPQAGKVRAKSRAKSSGQASGKKLIKYEKWHGITQADCHVRADASTNSAIVDTYHTGSRINYDRVYEANGYRWISYIGNSGKRRYVAYRRTSGNTRPWIRF